MLEHFENLKTPLQSVRQYPDLASQKSRFFSAGWLSASAHSLWDLWNDSTFLPAGHKTVLNTIEPFDEWEDFALFASHYSFLVARSTSKARSILSEGTFKNFHLRLDSDQTNASGKTGLDSMSRQSLSGIYSSSGGPRKFGSIMSTSQRLFGHYGGIGSQSRLPTTHVYRASNAAGTSIKIPPSAIEARMCQTITTLRGDSCLLVGGRTSPDRAMSDCWLYKDAQWEKVEEIPTPLYRHCAVAIGLDTTDPGVLVYGGRTTGGKVVNSWFLWRASVGWVRVGVLGSEIQPRFGAAMTSTGSKGGIVLGGIADDGSIGCGIWKWSVEELQSTPLVHLTEYDKTKLPSGDILTAIHRFGACLTWSSIGLLLVGGISKHALPQDYDILRLIPNLPEQDFALSLLEPSCISYSVEGPRLLLVGHSVCAFQDSLVIAGGGAVCFSFGSYWNRDVLTLNLGSGKAPVIWSFEGDQTPIPGSDQQFCGQPVQSVPSSLSSMMETESMRDILRLKVETSDEFMRMIHQAKPFIMEGLDLGPCQREWSLDVLKARIGPNRSVRRLHIPLLPGPLTSQVTVHEATEYHMDFSAKNFRYVTKPFSTFIDRVASGSMEYLRSLAVDGPATKRADFACDFPELAPDFRLPAQLDYVTRNAHSSPLRISGAVIVWLHYDVGGDATNVIASAHSQTGHGQCSLSDPRVEAHYPLSAR